MADRRADRRASRMAVLRAARDMAGVGALAGLHPVPVTAEVAAGWLPVKLMRNLSTEVVHRPDCSSKGKDAAPWHWAVMHTLDEVKAATSEYGWLHLCRTCMPACCRCEKCRRPAAAEAVTADAR